MKRITIGKNIHIGRVVIYKNHKNLDALLKDVEYIMKRAEEANFTEGHIRQSLQDAMENNDCPVSMTYNGNGVYPFTKTIRDFKRVVKANDTRKMTKHLYHFFSLCCGTIAHYNLYGWASVYPDNQALKELFFEGNEYGHPVVEYIPEWKTDTKRIVVEMEKILKGAVR
jgi:hypothetical protein